MTVLLSFITSIIGAFIGVYLKEFFSDIFFKKRRMRELRPSLIKNIVKFFSLMKVHANYYNGAEIHRHRLTCLKFKRREQDLAQSTIDALNNDISGIFDYGRELTEKDEKVYSALVEIKADISSAAIECSNYLEKHMSVQLRKSLDDMFLSVRTENILVKGYEQLEYFDLITFQDRDFPQQLHAISDDIDRNQKKFEKSINEILFP